MVMLRLVLRGRLVLGRRLVWRLQGRLRGRLVLVVLGLRLGRLRLGLRLMRRWQWRVQRGLQVRLCMCRQERLSRAG